MSLRFKLVVFFGAILALTTGVSALLGAFLAEQQVRNEIRDRALDSALTLMTKIKSNSETVDARDIRLKLKGVLREHSPASPRSSSGSSTTASARCTG